jgi:hypothetical protein
MMKPRGGLLLLVVLALGLNTSGAVAIELDIELVERFPYFRASADRTRVSR